MRVVSRTGSSRWLHHRRLVAALVVIGLGGVGLALWLGAGSVRVSAVFPSAKSLYIGSEVRMLGLRIGEIEEVTPEVDGVRVGMRYDAGYEVPADAHAVLVVPALVTSRYVELASTTVGGPLLADGAVIPKDRTSIPVEFDDLKEQIDRLTTALGPNGANASGSLSNLLDTAAGFEGLGAPFNETVDQVSEAVDTLATGRADLFGTVDNLQVFTAALAASDRQVAEFITRLDDTSGILDDNREALATAVRELDTAAVEVERFVGANRDRLAASTAKLSDVARVLSQQRPALEDALHVIPTVLTNVYNIYDSTAGSFTGVPTLANFQNPAQFVCSAIGAATNSTPAEAGRLCAEQLGPLLNLLQMDHPPVSANPLVTAGQREPAPPGPGAVDRPVPAERSVIPPGGDPFTGPVGGLLNPLEER